MNESMDEKIENAYFAGLFDSNGYISITYRKRGDTYRFMMYTYCNIEWHTNEWIKKWGGSQGARKAGDGGVNYVYNVGVDTALSIIKSIYPYLRFKREYAQLTFEFYQTIEPNNKGKPLSLDKKIERERIYYKFVEIQNRLNPQRMKRKNNGTQRNA